MRTTTVRELRHHFGDVIKWVNSGEEVEITKRKKPVAHLIPPPLPARPRKIKMPDFAARLDKIFPDGPVKGKSMAEIISEGRDRY